MGLFNPRPKKGVPTYRHEWPVRLSHWVNAAVVVILLASGLQIFNAHPALYWGEVSAPAARLLSVEAVRVGGTFAGRTTLFASTIDTTGVLGASVNSAGVIRPRAFPNWLTLPSGQALALGRRWHFFFAWVFAANGCLFGIHALRSGHLLHDLLAVSQGRPMAAAVRPKYSVFQRLSYSLIIFGIGPLLVLTGLAMSPGMNAAWPWLTEWFDGRQSARTLHFAGAVALAIFAMLHVLMVAVGGLFRNLHAMLTGWYYPAK